MQTDVIPKRTGSVQCICEYCGAEFFVPPSLVRRGYARRCSMACQAKARKRPPSERFWKHVDKTDRCWLWTGGKTRKGYGCFGRGGKGCGIIGAHRMAWQLTYGNIPEGLCVLHRCDNPPCVRPDHLFLGTRADNSKDMAEKGRSTRGERATGARLTADKVRSIRFLATIRGMTYDILGEAFGVTTRHIGQIVRKECWKHV